MLSFILCHQRLAHSSKPTNLSSRNYYVHHHDHYRRYRQWRRGFRFVFYRQTTRYRRCVKDRAGWQGREWGLRCVDVSFFKLFCTHRPFFHHRHLFFSITLCFFIGLTGHHIIITTTSLTWVIMPRPLPRPLWSLQPLYGCVNTHQGRRRIRVGGNKITATSANHYHLYFHLHHLHHYHVSFFLFYWY